MANEALAVLESALRAKKLDRTLTTVLPPLDRHEGSHITAPGGIASDAVDSNTVPSDIAALDASLRGGLPRGQLSELSGPRSSGRTTFLLQLLAAATRRGEIAALVDTLDRLDMASTAAAGVNLDRLLWIRGHPITSPEPSVVGPSSLVDRMVDRGLKALNLVLQSGGFGLVAIDLADVPVAVLKRLPFTTWLRIQRTIEGSETACVLIVPEPLARSARGLTLSLTGRTTWAGAADRSRRLVGVDVQVRVVSPRRRVDANVTVGALAIDSR